MTFLAKFLLGTFGGLAMTFWGKGMWTVCAIFSQVQKIGDI